MSAPHTRKVGKSYVALDSKGKMLGKHKTHAEAAKQVQAVYISQHKGK